MYLDLLKAPLININFEYHLACYGKVNFVLKYRNLTHIDYFLNNVKTKSYSACCMIISSFPDINGIFVFQKVIFSVETWRTKIQIFSVGYKGYNIKYLIKIGDTVH